jgi:biotin operon repressor
MPKDIDKADITETVNLTLDKIVILYYNTVIVMKDRRYYNFSLSDYILMELYMLKERVLKVLESGRQFTPAQLAGLTGSSEDSIRPRISELRAEGYAVYTNQTKNGKTAYRLGTPSRKMVAAAYAMFGGEAFSRA